MYKLKKRFSICCAHKLNNDNETKIENRRLFGKCNFVHGHGYAITLYLKSQFVNGKTGMLVNFDEIKPAFKKYIDDVYDHKYLNDCPEFENLVPTAENMARVFYTLLSVPLPDLYAVEVEETEGASAIYEHD